MPQIDFYILQQAVSIDARLTFSCKLTAKAFENQNSILLYTPNKNLQEKLNTLLWTYQDISFLPHQLSTTPVDPNISIFIGEYKPKPYQVLINLTEEIQECFFEYERILEVISQDIVQQGRDKFRKYREMGYEPHHHML